MINFILRRLFQSVIVLLIISVIVFLVMRLLPGDPILMLLTREEAAQTSPETLNELRHEYGLDKPIILQYFDWLKDIAQGNLGTSIIEHTSVGRTIARRAPITIQIGVLAFILSVVIGLPLGIVSAVRRGRWMDNLATLVANLGVTIPHFWLAIILIYFFSLKLKWLPVFGYTSPFTDLVRNIKQIIMPVFVLSIFSMASAARQTRSSMLEVLRQDYIRTAWSKGTRERVVIFKHTMKNALIPVITLMGVSFSHIIGGSVIIETVFNIPGMGRLLIDAINNKDYPIVQGEMIIIAIVVLLVNLLVDVSYGWFDPRIRFK